MNNIINSPLFFLKKLNSKNFLTLKILLISLLTITTLLFKANSQNKTLIYIERANSLEYDVEIGEDVNRFIGNVVFRHDNTFLYCDSAYLYSNINSVDAFSNVQIKASDTSNIYGDVLKYDGNTSIARMTGNVKMIDNQITLTTEDLTYDVKNKTASYPNYGVIVDLNNNLTSKKGYYYSDKKEFYFYDDVVLVNPNYTVYSDTLMYNTLTEIAYFFGPTTIVSEENNIYCERGYYNTAIDQASFSKNAKLRNKNQILKADSIFYDRIKGIGLGYNNVNIFDSSQNIIIQGNFAEYYEKQGNSRVSDSALLSLFNDGDTLFLHADTLIMYFDDSTKQGKLMKAFYKAKFFREDFQGMSDSLIYNFQDSTIVLYKNPVLWNAENQLTANEITIWFKGNKADSLLMNQSAFIISEDDIDKYNQVKGKIMRGYFKEGELDYVFVEQNAETVYYVRDDSSYLVGVNVASSLNMIIYLKDRTAKRITFIKNVAGKMYPEKELPDEDKKLKNFLWLEDRRPLFKEDIFVW